MELPSLKLTKKERTSDAPEVAVPSDKYEGPEYPYGLEISLEKDCLEKLGMDIDDFSVGNKTEMVCVGEITRTHESAGKHQDNASVSIQITNMAMKVQPNEEKKNLKDVIALIKGVA